jgi:hypothetical protein
VLEASGLTIHQIISQFIYNLWLLYLM